MMSPRLLRRATRGLTDFLRSDDPREYLADQRRKEDLHAQRGEETPVKRIVYDRANRTVTVKQPYRETP